MTTPQILVTGSTLATVEVTSSSPVAVEVSAPAVPKIVEINVRGPQGVKGDKGDTAVPPAVRLDTTTAGILYAGQAINSSNESAAVWRITRTTYSASGVRLTKGTATGVTWTGRIGHTYT